MAIALPLLCVAVGCAVDFGRRFNLRNDAQITLDNALLAAAATPATAQKTLDHWLESTEGPDFILVDLKSSADSVELAMEAEVEASIPASFLQLLGVNDLKVSVVSAVKAPLSLEEVDIEIKEAYGYSNKTIRAMVERPDGKKEAILTTNYVFRNPKGASGRGTGRTTTIPKGAVSTGAYKNLWFEMDVVEHDTKRTVTYSTEDPKTANHLYVDGKALAKGTTTSYNELVKCGENPSEHAWEDSANEGEWGTQDIVIVVKGKCAEGNAATVRLSR